MIYLIMFCVLSVALGVYLWYSVVKEFDTICATDLLMLFLVSVPPISFGVILFIKVVNPILDFLEKIEFKNPLKK